MCSAPFIIISVIIINNIISNNAMTLLKIKYRACILRLEINISFPILFFFWFSFLASVPTLALSFILHSLHQKCPDHSYVEKIFIVTKCNIMQGYITILPFSLLLTPGGISRLLCSHNGFTAGMYPTYARCMTNLIKYPLRTTFLTFFFFFNVEI